MSDLKEREMSVDEAIYCMTSYLPDNSVEKCVNCPYYGIKEQHFGDQCFYVCRSDEAHELAIKALQKLKEMEGKQNE